MPLDKRRAAVQARLPLILVRDIVGRTWGEAHRPTIVVPDDKPTSTWVQAFVRDTQLWLKLIEATWAGASGSACVVMRVLGDADDDVDDDGKPIVDARGKRSRTPKGRGRFHIETWPAKECKPVFRRSRPTELQSLERVYQVSSDTLAADGYDLAALEKRHDELTQSRGRTRKSRIADPLGAKTTPRWVMRVVLDMVSDTWYDPVPEWAWTRSDWAETMWRVDADRTTEHELGEVPARWTRPIPFPAELYPDGMCVFEPAIDFQFRADRTLSQTGRALDYTGDPQLAIDTRAKADALSEFGGDDAPAAGADAVLDGDARYVEIAGEGLRVAVDHYVKVLMRLGREVAGGSRMDEEKSVGAMSGTALRLLNASLDVLVGIYRTTMGEGLLVSLLRLGMRMSAKVEVELELLDAIAKQNELEAESIEPDPTALIDLQWPDAYAPVGQDLNFQVTAIETLASADGGPPLISHETAVALAASLVGVQDAKQEQANIVAETQLRQALLPLPPAPPAVPGAKPSTGPGDPAPAKPSAPTPAETSSS